MNKKAKRIPKVTALILAVGLMVGLAVFANAMIGNPVSRYLAEKTAEEYLSGKYGDTDFYVERFGYDFKSMCYHAEILSPTNVDVDFYLTIDMYGNLHSDSYNSLVKSGYNTGLRLARDYDDMVSAVFAQANGYGGGISYIYGNLERGERREIPVKVNPSAGIPHYALALEDLTAGNDYDVKLLGEKHGTVCAEFTEENISYKRAAEILLWIKDEMDKAGVGFYAVSLTLQEPPGGDNGESAPTDASIFVRSFVYDDIYEEGLQERVENAYKELMESYGDPVTYPREE